VPFILGAPIYLKGPSIGLYNNYDARCQKLRHSRFAGSLYQNMATFQADEIYQLFTRSKYQILQFLLERLKAGGGGRSDCPSGEQPPFKKQKSLHKGGSKAADTDDDCGVSDSSEFAVDEAIRLSETKGEREWRKRRNTIAES